MATGRKSCLYCVSTIELTRRHNIIYTTIGRFFSKEADRFAFEIPINMNPVSPFVFAMLPTSQKDRVVKNYEDLRIITRAKQIPNIPSEFVILSENEESTNWILSSEIIRYINTLSSIIEMIFITDQLILPAKVPLTLRCNFLLPKDRNNRINPQHIEMAFKLAISLADKASSYKISSQAKEIGIRLRNGLKQKSE